MPVIVLFPDDDTTEDEAALLAAYQAFLEANPLSTLSFAEWLAEYR